MTACLNDCELYISTHLAFLSLAGKTTMAKVLDALWVLLQEFTVVFGFLSVVYKVCKPLFEIASELILQLWSSQQRQKHNQHERRRLMRRLRKLQQETESYQSLIQQRMLHNPSLISYTSSHDENREDLPSRIGIDDPGAGDETLSSGVTTHSTSGTEIRDHNREIERHTSAFKHVSRRWER